MRVMAGLVPAIDVFAVLWRKRHKADNLRPCFKATRFQSSYSLGPLPLPRLVLQ
jgi:hypothetical protein